MNSAELDALCLAFGGVECDMNKAPSNGTSSIDGESLHRLLS